MVERRRRHGSEARTSRTCDCCTIVEVFDYKGA
jgi:hypothetical protein